MKEVKIIIGANWGDEGKGLMTDYFAANAKNKGMSCIVVCHNGGAQKGHTVKTTDGRRHVFSHFGSGAFEDASTYLASTYILNPYLFNKEYDILTEKNAKTETFVSKKACLSTPYDIIINKILEDSRGENRHGSCGVGIFETVMRNRVAPITMEKFLNAGYETKFAIINEIRQYYLPMRLENLGLKEIPEKYKEIIANDDIIENFIDDFDVLLERVTITDDNILSGYDYVIFEGAQGLALDQNNLEGMPHLTPSNTGSINPCNILSELNIEGVNVETCYVTRSYFTRHGAGVLPSECDKANINPDIVDLTNGPNEYQKTIRYGYFDAEDLLKRINKDVKCYTNINTTFSIALTHLNYTNWLTCTANGMKEFNPDKFNLYESDAETYKGVTKKEP